MWGPLAVGWPKGEANGHIPGRSPSATSFAGAAQLLGGWIPAKFFQKINFYLAQKFILVED